MLVAAGLAGAVTCSATMTSHELERVFANPPCDYSTAPLWVWNDMLTEAQIRDTLRDLASQHVKQVFVHPRPGLMTPYLSKEWFDLWRIALDEARELDMNVWIYDENSYPSGFAGGFVPEAMPESRGRGLVFQEIKQAPVWQTNWVAAYRVDGQSCINVTEALRSGQAVPEGRYVAAQVQRAGTAGWHGGWWYVDLLYPGVTEKFIEITMDAYKREIGKQFGRRVPGVFTDEPNLRPAGGHPWTEDLPTQFEKRWGYSLLNHLPSLTQPVGDWQRVRHNYFKLLSELYIDRWAKPFFTYCATNSLEFTGHYWDHDWPDCTGVPDNMAMYAWHQRPAIDILMNQYREDTQAQFGNVRILRELSSAANQMGYQRTLCEAYGAGGWDLRFEDMKRIGDWLYALGVNTMDQHLSYITIRGARKRDHPQSFSYHEPWWQDYHVSAQYFERLTAALAHGEQVNPFLVIEPTSTAWIYNGSGSEGGQLGELGRSFFDLLMDLDRNQVEYDLGCEDIMARHGHAEHQTLVVGKRSYQTVVIPPHCVNLNSTSATLLENFLAEGGRILCAGEVPTLVDGQPSDRLVKLSRQTGWTQLGPQELVTALRGTQDRLGFIIERSGDDAGILFHRRQRLEDGELLFLVNTSLEYGSQGMVRSDARGVREWDLNTGKASPAVFRANGGGVEFSFDLPPCGSRLVFLSKKPVTPAESAPVGVATLLKPSGPVDIKRLGPNVLVLDYVDVAVGTESRTNIYFYRANQFAFQKNGMAHNPWDSAVQFRDQLITKTFPADSGVQVAYHFNIQDRVPADLAIVIERPDLYQVSCNGTVIPGESTRQAWWLDKAFGRIPIASLARVGENIVTLKASPFTIWHEIEPTYVLGSFTLKNSEHGFAIAPDAPLVIAPLATNETHNIAPNGTQWLSGGIGYEKNGQGRDREDRAPWIVFDLGGTNDLSAVRIWNYNEGDVRDLTQRGVSRMRVLASATSSFASAQNLGEFALAKANATTPAEVLPLKAHGVRYVKFEILANHAGVSFPAKGEVTDNGFTGLAEVQFLNPSGERIERVKVSKVSSELASHQRLARYVVDGSGLTRHQTGWDGMGHPFYSEGVVYQETFDIDKATGRYAVALPNWYGAVARVKVNGQPAGHIVSAPWECDITSALKNGRNVVEITVVGTLKNTLGPHHAGSGLGAAWPGMFQVGPEMGPPAGTNYHTVAYGLFEPFVIKHRR